MPDNVEANAGSGGAIFATIDASWSGDTANFAGSFLVLASGSEGSWSVTALAGGAGAVSAGVQRMTLASDDPAVSVLGATGDAAATQGSTGSISAKLRTVTSQLNTIASTGIPITGTVTVGSHAVTNAGTFAVQVDGTALTRLTDIETNTDSCAVVGNGAAATAQRVTIANDSTGIVALTTSTASIGKLAANSGVDIGDVDVASIAAGDNNIGNVDIVTVPGDPFGANADAASATGSISAKLRFIASTGIPITGTVTVGSHAVTNAGTFAVQAAQSGSWTVSGTGTAGSAATGVVTVQGIASMTPLLVTAQASTNTQEVVGDAAHDAAIAGNPLRIGGRALSADYSAVSTGDTADLITSLLGKQVMLPYALPGASWSYATGSGGVTDTSDDEAKAAGGAGVRHYITSVQVINGHASTSTEVLIKDGSSVIWRGWAQAAGGGAAAKFDPPLRGTANTAVNVANGTNSSQTYFNLQGFTAGE